MVRPAEPEYYWLLDGGEWEIVKVQENRATGNLEIAFHQYEDTFYVDQYTSDTQWGGRITRRRPSPIHCYRSKPAETILEEQQDV